MTVSKVDIQTPGVIQFTTARVSGSCSAGGWTVATFHLPFTTEEKKALPGVTGPLPDPAYLQTGSPGPAAVPDRVSLAIVEEGGHLQTDRRRQRVSSGFQ